MNELDIGEEIKSSKRGSDVHGLVEKIAYFYHLGDNSSSSIRNWFRAQATLYRWTLYKFGEHPEEFLVNLECSLHKKLGGYAYGQFQVRYFWGDPGTSYDDWVHAVNELARQVMREG